jgi:hypothetical protein
VLKPARICYTIREDLHAAGRCTIMLFLNDVLSTSDSSIMFKNVILSTMSMEEVDDKTKECVIVSKA